MAASPLPLAGIRVIDFTNAVAGPTASFILGDLGAEVIKVESPTARSPQSHGTPLRSPDLPDRPWNRMHHFNELNRSKLGIVLDVAHTAGREALLRLAAVSDVFIENFAPRVVGNLGIDYPDLAAVRPDIVYLSMPAFGKSGPYRNRISYGPGIDAMSGLSHLTGYEDGPPMKPGNYYCDQNAGLLAVVAALAALRHRARTGEGQYIELAMIEGEIQLVAGALLDVQMNGRVQGRTGNRDTSMAPHGVYPTRGSGGGGQGSASAANPRPSPPGPLAEDAWIAIAVGSDAEWQALCRVIGQPELGDDPRFADVVSRYRHQRQADAIIAAWTAQHDHHEAMRLLQAAGVRAAAALTMRELFEDPHVRARRVLLPTTHPEMGPMPHTRAAFRLTAAPTAGPRRPAPCFGEHNDAVILGLLGLAPDRLETLRRDGTVTDTPQVIAMEPSMRRATHPSG
jgi:crotonobetainyl-CoA:carnitine CoA-transferase CaiB-like acyl-CoA transferase